MSDWEGRVMWGVGVGEVMAEIQEDLLSTIVIVKV